MSLIYIDEPVAYQLPDIIQGEDWNFSFSLNNPDNTPVNLTGMSFAMMMRQKVDDFAPFFTPTVSVTGNTVTFTIANVVTTAQPKGALLAYDLFQTDSLDKKLTLMAGSVTFKKAVTR